MVFDADEGPWRSSRKLKKKGSRHSSKSMVAEKDQAAVNVVEDAWLKEYLQKKRNANANNKNGRRNLRGGLACLSIDQHETKSGNFVTLFDADDEEGGLIALSSNQQKEI